MVVEAGPHAPSELVAWVSMGAITLGTLIAVGQMDVISRRLLSPSKLYEKRRRAHQYTLDKLVDKLNDKLWPKHMHDSTVILDSVEEYKVLLDQVLDKKSTNVTLEIISVVQEVNMVNDIPIKGDIYWILKKTQGDSTLWIQLPLLGFGLYLADRMQAEMSSTTLCFVADASAGLGLDILESVMETVIKHDSKVALLRQPSWMLAFSHYLDHVPPDKASQLLFASTRLQAWKFRHAQTLVLTLPTQSVTAPLLPLLQTVFSSERHVFVYQGARASVARATSLADTLTMTPILPPRLSSQKTYKHSLAHLNAQHASALEAWMSSVDTYLQLKDSPEYLPFALQLKLLLDSDATLETHNGQTLSQQRVCLSNVLQYMLGNKSRQSQDFETMVDACLVHFSKVGSYTHDVTDSVAQRIQNVVFCHKSILIGDKTLVDTVRPMLKWTLKAPKKSSGCACCAPEEEDDEDELFSKPPVSQSTLRKRNTTNNYVDGTMKFAFDPTKFDT